MNFDSIAPLYRVLETVAFGRALQTARVAFLGEIGNARRALIAGEGNGRFLEALLCQHPRITVDCVDASARMLQFAKARVKDDQRVRFLHEDLTRWSPDENFYDVIVTHFFLDCFVRDEVAGVVAKLARAAKANSLWLLTDFAVPSSGFARLHARLWLGTMYRFFRLTTRIKAQDLVEPGEFLRAHDFHLIAQTPRRFGLIKSEIWRR